MKGTVEYEDVILFITDITLKDGEFRITAEGAGPAAEYHGPMRMYGPDGVLVQDGGHIDVPAASARASIWLDLACTPSSPAALT